MPHKALKRYTLHLIFVKNKFRFNVATNQVIALSLLNVIIRWNWKAKQAIDKIYMYIAHTVWGVEQRKKNQPSANNVTSASISVRHPERTFALCAKIESLWRHTLQFLFFPSLPSKKIFQLLVKCLFPLVSLFQHDWQIRNVDANRLAKKRAN